MPSFLSLESVVGKTSGISFFSGIRFCVRKKKYIGQDFSGNGTIGQENFFLLLKFRVLKLNFLIYLT